MNAIILAGGFATRLYPLTQHQPKALLTIQGQPILKYITDDLSRIPHITQAVLVSNHRYASKFQEWLKAQDFSFPLTLLDNTVNEVDARKGAIGDLALAIHTLPKQDTLVVASDTLVSEKISSFVDCALAHHKAATMLIDLKDTRCIAGRFGCAVVNDDDIITQFEEKPVKPPSTLAAIPYYFLPKETLPYVDEYLVSKNSIDAPGSFINWLIKQVPVYGMVVKNGYYFDIGTPADLEKAQALA